MHNVLVCKLTAFCPAINQMKGSKRLCVAQQSNDPTNSGESNGRRMVRPTVSSKSILVRAAKTKTKTKTKTKRQSASTSTHVDLPIENSRILSFDFYQIDALDLAPLLLGKYLRRDDVVLRITEVEAYRPNDSACHGRFGVTARTAPVFGNGGNAYVYLCYGLHMMLNIVADKKDVGAAVLIRSCSPVSGLKTIQQRRGLETDKPILLTGPGKVGQALGISTQWSNHPLYKPGGLELIDGPRPEKMLVGPRVGINYALPEHVNALWRFAIADTPWISSPRNTLRPPPNPNPNPNPNPCFANELNSQKVVD